MAKLKKNQKVYRVKFMVFADILTERIFPDDSDGEDAAMDAGTSAEQEIEQALNDAGFQNAQACVNSVTVAPDYAQTRKRGEVGI